MTWLLSLVGKWSTGTWLIAHWRLIAALIGALAVAVALWRAFEGGRSYEQSQTEQATTDAYRNRSALDENLAVQTDIDLCRRAGGGDLCGRMSAQP